MAKTTKTRKTPQTTELVGDDNSLIAFAEVTVPTATGDGVVTTSNEKSLNLDGILRVLEAIEKNINKGNSGKWVVSEFVQATDKNDTIQVEQKVIDVGSHPSVCRPELRIRFIFCPVLSVENTPFTSMTIEKIKLFNMGVLEIHRHEINRFVNQAFKTVLVRILESVREKVITAREAALRESVTSMLDYIKKYS